MNASTRMMMVGLLAVVPALAAARSEYAECLAEQNQQRSFRSLGGFRPAARVATVSYRSYSSADSLGYYSGYSSYSYLSRLTYSSDGYADQLAVMVRACRQFKEKPQPPKFRVTGVKSPAHVRAGNRHQDADAE